MIYCFDIDGTITEHPLIFANLMESLVKAGHEVYPLTASVDTLTDPSVFEDIRVRQLAALGLKLGVHYTDVVVCLGPSLEACGELKGTFCKQNRVNFMVEDTTQYAQAIRKASPDTLCLRMPNGL